MGILINKRCNHCGGQLVEELSYPEGDREVKCILCCRVDNPRPVLDYVLTEISKKRYIQGRHRKRNI